LSFFEMTVGMAFDYFAKQEVDIAIIEVGLGGRLDSTNIIVPEISLITNIGLDHQDLLGNTLEKIAYEKAGIIKEGVPVVVSEYQEEVASVFKEITSEKKTTLTFASEKEYRKYKLPLQGNYQEKNIKGVLEVISQLSSFNIQESDIVKGLSNVIKNTGLLGRWQILAKKPLTICDTAHNKEGLSLVLSQVGQQEFRELHLVIGFVKEKDLDGILPLFPKKAIYYFCKPQVPRGLDVEILKEKAGFYNLLGESYSSAKKAYEAAMQRADPEDLIFIGGSTFTVSDVL
ncbi:MAG: Mur ligase family protein, partial [Eudoraea sp.]